MFMNECEIDEALQRFRDHPVLGRATRFLAAYRDEVNRKSDGWPYWGSKAAGKLCDLIYHANPWVRSPERHEPTEAEVRKAIAPIKAFCTKRGLTCSELEKPPATPKRPKPHADRSGQFLLPGIEGVSA